MSHDPRDPDDQRPPPPSTQPSPKRPQEHARRAAARLAAAEAVDACLGRRWTAAHATAADGVRNSGCERWTRRELAWR